MAELKSEHADALTAANKERGELQEAQEALQLELKNERAEKASALNHIQQFSSTSGGLNESPRTAHIAQLEDTLAQLRAEVARRDVADAPNVPDDVGVSPLISPSLNANGNRLARKSRFNVSTDVQVRASL